MIKQLQNFLISRIFSVIIVMIIQLLFIILVPLYFSRELEIINIALRVLSVIIAIVILNKPDLNPSYKMAWVIVILLFPLLGGLLYLILGNKRIPKELQMQGLLNFQNTTKILQQNEKAMKKMSAENRHIHNQFEYLWRNAVFPTYDNNKVDYFPTGEAMFAAMLDELKKAEKFIFMEYFIVDFGVMWTSILEILKEKAAAGVEVRFLYDDFGCSANFPDNYNLTLQTYGINAKAFNPLRPMLAVQMNNRDHRKITIIDGRLAFTGGINLADEYINKVTYFGYWKDGGIKVSGDAVFNFTVMFLQMFGGGLSGDVEQYRYQHHQRFNDAIICPFCDSPTDQEVVGKSVHMNIINNALEYLYITTPYLIIDQELLAALVLAAKRGVDVAVVLPHIPDKWYAHLMSQANYYYLVNNGVKVYEYEPGFIHSKIVLADDNIVCVGTINLDYRSYYLHYECGALIYRAKCLVDIKKDLQAIFTTSILITKEKLRQENIFKRIVQAILSMLSPMM